MELKDLLQSLNSGTSKNDNSIEAQARRTGIRLIDENSELWQRMNQLQHFGARSAQDAVLRAATEHALAPLHFKGRILDFGCGVGGSSYFLSSNGAEVDAVDLPDSSIEELKKLDLSSVHIIEQDGLALMQGKANSTYDMVTAFMLGPDSTGDFVKSFYTQANRLINPNGRILITSDGNTFSLLTQNYRGNYGNNLHQSNIFIGRKNPAL